MSKSNYTFSQVPTADIPRSTFRRNHGHKTTFDAGWLIPIYVDEALPGDTFRLSASLFARLATPIVPIMDNIFCDVFFFAVPNRLVWDNWQKFCGEQENPGDSTDYVIPQITTLGGFPAGSLYDYLGLPTLVSNLSVNALPVRSYALIYNEWFRDENLIDSVAISKGDAPEQNTAYELYRRGKRHDYFTSCLPWPQKGPGVELSLGGTAPVMTSPTALLTGAHPNLLFSDVTGASPPASYTLHTGQAPNQPQLRASSVGGTAAGIQLYPNNLYADLSAATAATINSLREAFQIQKMLERDARGGTRYVEILKSHFRVESPDARLQRPEFLGGGSFPININPVAQTSGSADTGGYTDTPQGNLSAFGVGGSNKIGFSKSFVEHCYIIGLISARADYTYQQGINRMWKRETRYDFYWPALSHLGEQAVLQQEIFASGTPTADDTVFGYQERWAEYRYHPSIISGEFRSNYPQTLDYWHLAQDFPSAPILNQTFIQENPPIDRIIAVPDEPHFLLDCHFKLTCARPMPLYSVPGLVDHF